MMHGNRYNSDIERLRNPERLARLEVERVIALVLEGKTLRRALDVGVGSGVFAEAFAGMGLEVQGVDVNPEMVAAAKRFVPEGQFKEGVAEALPFDDASVDVVFMGLVLHETDDTLQAIREAARVATRRVAVLEWPYRVQEFGPELAERLTEEQVRELAQQAGLSLDVFNLTSFALYRMDKAGE